MRSEEAGGLRPILCAPLIRQVDRELIRLLRSLSPADWDRQTVAPQWKVRDVAAHLLDTALRKLSAVRDSWFVENVVIRMPQDVGTLVNRLNREGVTVYRRLSPAVLIDMMKIACEQSADFHESLDPFAPAVFPVSWAGESTSLNWFDTARELTERWHHQQQIRLATNRPGIMDRDLYYPVLDCFIRGLPHLYRDVDVAVETAILLEISGDCGGRWILFRQSDGWRFVGEGPTGFAARVTIPQELAWRVFTKGIDRASAQIAIDGNRLLGEKVLEMGLNVMAFLSVPDLAPLRTWIIGMALTAPAAWLGGVLRARQQRQTALRPA